MGPLRAGEPARLAAAHNCGLQLAKGAIVAFTDDDVLVDRYWLTEVVKGFQADTGVACVTGLIMPTELQTPAQVALESHGHFSKGFQQRGLTSAATGRTIRSSRSRRAWAGRRHVVRSRRAA